jgi:hypothetical protein
MVPSIRVAGTYPVLVGNKKRRASAPGHRSRGPTKGTIKRCLADALRTESEAKHRLDDFKDLAIQVGRSLKSET